MMHDRVSLIYSSFSILLLLLLLLLLFIIFIISRNQIDDKYRTMLRSNRFDNIYSKLFLHIFIYLLLFCFSFMVKEISRQFFHV